jgi:acyl-CoA thioesterase I
MAGPALAEAEPATVVALGDSLTAGYGLAPDQGFVPRLQAWLDAHGADAVVLNAGVSGDTTAGGLSRVDWALTPEVDAVIVELGGNDYLRGLDPAVSRENLRGILEKVKERGLPALLVGLDASSQYGPDYEAAFDGMYPALAREFGTLLEPDFFAALKDEGEASDAIGVFLQPDGIHPNPEGVERIVARIGPRVLELLAQ